MQISELQKARYGYKPKLPQALSGELSNIKVELGEATGAVSDEEELRQIFKKTFGKPVASFSAGKGNLTSKQRNVGVILSGGQAPGGHNVIAGLFDGLKKDNVSSRLLGFAGGPSGLIENKFIEITPDLINEYRNTGGFDMIGSGRTKIETKEQFAAALETANKNKLDAVVIIGGDDSNTNAALLAEYFEEHGASTSVIGCPKTIDGDLKNSYIETSFGFDTAVKTYSELIGNIMRDSNSAKKYWHFIRLMGRAASHIALEAALQTHPNICLISEEIEEKRISLSQIVEQFALAICKRAEKGENFGVALIPEGLVEFIPEMKKLISEINDIIAVKSAEFAVKDSFEAQRDFLQKNISGESFAVFDSIPLEIAKQLLFDRDSHGNVQVSRIETEKLIIGMLEEKLKKLKKDGVYKGSFSALGHFFGYEGRAAAPSNFDADYCYSLGFSAFVLIAAGLTGYISSVRGLVKPAERWSAGGIPLTMMMNLEKRHGAKKPVIKKALVELNGKPFKSFEAARDKWSVETSFVYPGAIQYYGPSVVCDATTITLRLEHEVK
ncbi:MAG: diphosphate--fructose-6-phosphate 1-phosphotransferase [Spirochaetaceae bacterium]|jgi:pyrophosphate--fructose-6-phosphate 1-phosphotransferase|nr:diphosphate--fructose-6-phosphate 1-phosphotransferase [Spirochaetaceae bacterium]